MITEDSYYLMRAYNYYKAGHLPCSQQHGYGSGIMEQPNIFLEAIDIIGGQYQKIADEKMVKVELEAKRLARA